MKWTAKVSMKENAAKLSRMEGTRIGMNIANAVNIEDLRRMAKRRLPRMAFDFIEGENPTSILRCPRNISTASSTGLRRG